MAQFWIATLVFVILGITPMVVSTVLNRRDSHAEEPEAADQEEATP